ncbi:nitroreductase family protein [Mariniluteicoccus flavus]
MRVDLAPDDVALADGVLSTTRAVRRRLDLARDVDDTLLRDALSVAAAAPSAGAEEPVRWVVVRDPEARRRIGDAYAGAYRALDSTRAPAADDRTRRVRASSAHLADVMGEVPVHVLACSSAAPPTTGAGADGARYWASVLPAVWSLQVALRARGLGSCLTTIGLNNADAITAAARVPEGWTLCALLPVAHITGDELRAPARAEQERTTLWV